MTSPPPDTPSEFLLWAAEGPQHVHNHQEAQAGTWRPFAWCNSCPWRLPWAEAEEVTPTTQVIRRREGT